MNPRPASELHFSCFFLEYARAVGGAARHLAPSSCAPTGASRQPAATRWRARFGDIVISRLHHARDALAPRLAARHRVQSLPAVHHAAVLQAGRRLHLLEQLAGQLVRRRRLGVLVPARDLAEAADGQRKAVAGGFRGEECYCSGDKADGGPTTDWTETNIFPTFVDGLNRQQYGETKYRHRHCAPILSGPGTIQPDDASGLDARPYSGASQTFTCGCASSAVRTYPVDTSQNGLGQTIESGRSTLRQED